MAQTYAALFQAMITSWRTQWGQPEMPFIFVQLPGYLKVIDTPYPKSFWGELRDAQSQVLDMPNVHMVVTTDIGQESIHPSNKIEVTRRLLNTALAEVYGRKGMPHQYPRVIDVKFRGPESWVKFANPNGKLVTMDGRPVKGFAVAGDDRQWHWADGRVEGDSVVVQCEQVPAPVAVRYNYVEQTTGWGNLVDSTGLPAAPYRSDQW
jgi:sialate O-acetylesterase